MLLIYIGSDNIFYQERGTLKKVIPPLIVVMILTSGCIGNVVHGPTQEITFRSLPSGAEVTIDGAFEGVTPLSIELKRRESHQAVISLAGYEDANFHIRKSVSGGIIISDILVYGGSVLLLIQLVGDGRVGDGRIISDTLLSAGIALIFDLVTGGLYNLNPTDISTSLNNVSVRGSIVNISLNQCQGM